MKLTDRTLQSLKPEDGEVTDDARKGLAFIRTAKGGRWTLYYTSPTRLIESGKNKGKPRRCEMSLGLYPEVSLAAARQRCDTAREMIGRKLDPLDERKSAVVEFYKQNNIPTFGEAARAYHESASKAWKQTDNVAQWIRSVETYLVPILRRKVDTLTAQDFADALRDEWLKHPRMSEDVLSRARHIMDWAHAMKHVDSIAPLQVQLARKLLPPRNKHTNKTTHHPSLPWRELPAYVAKHLVDIGPCDIVRACIFVQIHTAVRPGEARGMQWTELDLDRAQWKIPGERMKMKVAHITPLPPAVVALLRTMEKNKMDETYVFPATGGGAPLSDFAVRFFLQKTNAPSDTEGKAATAHGFRSTLTNWALDMGYSERVADRQLAHGPRGAVNQAYDRTTLLDQRVRLVNAYADYIRTAHIDGNVVPLAQAA
ncbi:integrase [Paraburkholderia youngii]|uniref:tyrosine-type recombinase/integrase n=1 Tax=Paraburkholderia youngii TaxID=2782701 RepID=UPI003D21A160